MIRSHRPFLIAALGVFALAAGSATAQLVIPDTLFSDDFSEPNGTYLPGKMPDVGIAWTQPTGGALQVQDGSISTVGAGRVAWGGFEKAFDGSTRVLKLTVDFTLLNHNAGFGGVSLFDGATERIFFGDPSGTDPSMGVSSNGLTVRARPDTPAGLVSLIYDFETGRIRVYAGATSDGQELASLAGAAGWNFDRIRIANGNGGDLAVGLITVEAQESAPPLIDYFTGLPQIELEGFGHTLAWGTSFFDDVSISGLGAVDPSGTMSVTPEPGDATYQLTATDTATSATQTRDVTVRTVVGGSVSYRYLRYTSVKRRGNTPWSQLSEMYFYDGGTLVSPVAVTSPGANNPSAAEDFTKVSDGDTTTKWLDFASTPLIFDFGAPVPIDSYSFVTGNDDPARDPARWIFEGSADGTTWQLVENVSAFDYLGTLARRASPGLIPFPGVSLLPFAALSGNASFSFSGEPVVITYQALGATTAVFNDGVSDQNLAPGTGGFVVNPTETTTYTLTVTNANELVSTAQLTVTVISPAIDEIAYANFDDSSNELSLLGNAGIVNAYPDLPLPGDAARLRLTAMAGGQVGNAWFRKRQDVGQGFETNFGMHITRTDGGNGADGMAFIIQNSSQGSELVVASVESGGAADALTIAFDTYINAGDPSAALLRVASSGNVLALVDLTTVPGLALRGDAKLLDPTGQAAPYQVRITYDGALLDVDLDGVRILTGLAVDLAALGAVDENGAAIVGFGARTGGSFEAHDITSWTLTSGAPAAPLRLISSNIDTAAGEVTLTWQSVFNRHYRVTTSADLADWSTVLVNDITGEAGQTTTTASFTGGPKGFFRVEEIPGLPQ